MEFQELIVLAITLIVMLLQLILLRMNPSASVSQAFSLINEHAIAAFRRESSILSFFLLVLLPISEMKIVLA